MRWADIRRSASTGENRCWPCTALNLAFVGGVALWLYRRDRRAASLVAAVLGTVAVGVWGYVVPYTPRFAPRLVEALPVAQRVFGKDGPGDVPGSASLTGAELDGTTVLEALAAAGALEADGDVIRPTAAVDTTWREEMDRLSDEPLDALAEEAATTIPRLTGTEPFSDGNGEWVVVDGGLVARPVVVAELAAYRALGETVGDRPVRLAGARAFRMFLDSCPGCETALVESSTVSCCGGYGDPQTKPEDVLVCPQCAQRVFTMPT